MSSAAAVPRPDTSGAGPIPNLKLSDGNEIPMLGYGLGTANFKRGNKAAFNQQIVDNTVMAIKNGYYHLDGAEAYGNEEELGAAIKAAGVARSKLFVTAKTSCRAGESVETAFARSLERLGLEYVDLYLIHNPFWAVADAAPEVYQRKWAEMEAIKASGRARSVGVSNYLVSHLEAILAAAPRHPPVVNQVEYHPYLQHDADGDAGLLDYCRRHGIAVEAYAPLAAITRAAPGPCDAVYDRLARKYGVPASDVALRWCLDQDIVTLTTSSSAERLQGVLARLPTFTLAPDEIREIADAGRLKHYRGFWTAKFAADDRR
ncbi:NADP-dependent oxidoreductase domain-containing protein [Lasiosphaeria miniovina]|uniref:NADP-dependent oxidoreductase domain-containing protein n=1 Tax=Lasiosphaeria miniovina TaxID=1954250 RepID=A0AA39ZZL6_9PEZI|nr:NADP-dependent oxidoreductase domain-containing protein [Lasiosphaeria miniovina]KAK0706557.1 NADP-dependent oxidoreductase domain-containing protein [Lasiosphaeria miniovina]